MPAPQWGQPLYRCYHIFSNCSYVFSDLDKVGYILLCQYINGTTVIKRYNDSEHAVSPGRVMTIQGKMAPVLIIDRKWRFYPRLKKYFSYFYFLPKGQK